ncbi:MAG: AraC family transcriptional regulator [Lachnospiraceae bacterium]
MIPSRETEEKRQHSTAFIPYSYYDCRIPKDFMNVPMHWHSEFEINYIIRGKGEFICGDNKFTAGEGDILFLPPNMLHAVYPCENNELLYYALVFHPVMLGAAGNDRCTTQCIRPLINGNLKINPLLSTGTKNYSELKAITDRIFYYAQSNLPQLDLLLKSSLLQLIWLLENDENIVYRKDTGISYSEIIRPALEFMMQNFQENVNIDQLAGIVHLSKSYFMNCFKKAVGIGAVEHLTQLRINAACDALSSTRKAVSDIAFGCGYSNLSNFNRQFKKIVGCSPNEYRKRFL